MPLLDLTNQPADLCWQSHADILGPTSVDETITPNFNYQPRRPRPSSEQVEEEAKWRRIREYIKRRDTPISPSAPQLPFNRPTAYVPRAFDIARHVKPH